MDKALEQAFTTILKQIVQTFFNKLQQKSALFEDSDRMIEEANLRLILSQSIDKMDNAAITQIISSMKYNIEPNIYNPDRKIYIIEFFQIFEKKLVIDLKNHLQILEEEQNKLQLNPLLQTIQNDYEGLVLKGFERIEERRKQVLTGLFVPKEGKFVNAPEKAFAVNPSNDREIMSNFFIQLEDYFKPSYDGSYYKRVENLCQMFYKHLRGYDAYNKGYLEKEKFQEILEKNFHKLTRIEVNQIIDFALSVSKVDETPEMGNISQYISYPFLCLQLSKYYSMASLLEVMKETKQKKFSE